MDKIKRKAYAKINLGLDVLRRREDGYHEVRMVMQTIDLYDTLTFQKTDKEGIVVITDQPELPGDENNLIYKAAKLMKDTYQIKQGIEITLIKRIPMAAGMAGGSTDAAAVFHAMNEMYELQIPVEELCTLSVQIGADVPYCICGGTALAEGIGERLTMLADAPCCTLLIAKPNIEVSTKFVYENLHADQLTVHPDIDGIIHAIENNSLQDAADKMENVLETVTIRAYPVIDEIKSMMKELGAMNALMSGSGPTVFGMYLTDEKAEAAGRQLKDQLKLKQVLVTKMIGRHASRAADAEEKGMESK